MSMSSLTNRPTFDFEMLSTISKLNRGNYYVWKMKMESLFNTHNIMGIVDGSIPRPETDGIQQDAWDKSNKDAFAAMVLTMSDPQMDFALGSTTAHELWTKLKSMLQDSQELLWSKYYALTMSQNSSPVKTMLEVQSYAARLRSTGAAIDDFIVVWKMLSLLTDKKFDSLVLAWKYRAPSEQTTENLFQRLKAWELRHEASKKTGSRSKMSEEEIAELKKRTKCHSCKRSGHWKSECPQKNVNEKMSNRCF